MLVKYIVVAHCKLYESPHTVFYWVPVWPPLWKPDYVYTIYIFHSPLKVRSMYTQK